MSHVQYEVGLFKRQGIGLGIGPLFEYLVADAPKHYAGVVAVTYHQVGQVTLVPLVKETGVVAVGLAAAPHVKAFIHDQESHAVAEVQQDG